MVDVTINDLMRSETAERLGINNSLPADRKAKYLVSLEIVVEVLNDIQRRFDSPVVVTSGYRCEALNRVVGGASNSQHMVGEAVDFFVRGVTLFDVFIYILDNVEYDQVIMYRRKHIIHLSVRPLGCVRKTAIIR